MYLQLYRKDIELPWKQEERGIHRKKLNMTGATCKNVRIPSFARKSSSHHSLTGLPAMNKHIPTWPTYNLPVPDIVPIPVWLITL